MGSSRALGGIPRARAFAQGLYEFLYGRGSEERKFEEACVAVAELPRKQTRVVTWPIVTVFGFLTLPERHIFLKPNTTRIAAREYGFEFHYESARSGRRTRACWRSPTKFAMMFGT